MKIKATIGIVTLLIVAVVVFGWQKYTEPTADFIISNVYMSSNRPQIVMEVTNNGESARHGAQLKVVIDGTTLVKSGPGGYDYSPIATEGHIYEGYITPPEASSNHEYTLQISQDVLESGIHSVTISLNSDDAIKEKDKTNNSYEGLPQIPIIPHKGE